MGGDDSVSEEADVQGDGVWEEGVSDSEGVLDHVREHTTDEIAQFVFHRRCSGDSWTEITAAVYLRYQKDIGAQYAATLYRKFQVSLSEAYGPEDRAQLLFLENERLDRVQRAFWDDMLEGDSRAGKIVLDVMKHRATINGLNQVDLRDRNIHNNVLILGEDTRSWVEALAHHNSQVTSGMGDDVVEEAHDE